jgi:predicted ABC-type ATPase
MSGLILVTGPPGAGKSTVASALAARFDPSVLVSGDSFFGFLATGAVAPWRPESQAQNEVVTEASALAAGRFAREYTTVFDGMVGPWFLPTFAAATGLDRLDYVIILPSVDRCLTRVATRRDHGFDDPAATRKMHAEFVGAIVDPRHVLVDPPEGVETCADLIVAGVAAGRFACPSRRWRATTASPTTSSPSSGSGRATAPGTS